MMLLYENFQRRENLNNLIRSYDNRKISSMEYNNCSKLCISSIAFLVIFGQQVNGKSITRFSLIQVPRASGASSNCSFDLYWNVPTFMCHKYGIFFEDVQSFGIQQNRKDQFRGDKLAILYDPGVFPALLKDENGRTVQRNGGVPQEGNLTYHLEIFRKHVNEQMKDVNFSGLAIIDFESWRPVFRQNWGSLAPYRSLSTEIERARHPLWDKNRVSREAVRRFEKSARLFMEDTLRLARTLRPRASWGYYAYPYCFNLTPNVPSAECDPKVFAENNGLSWMFNLQDVILPSVYLRASLNKNDRTGLITGRVNEAIRMSKRFTKPKNKPVLPYFWYKYQDERDKFLTSEDLFNGFKTIRNLGGDGIVLWGSSTDLDTKLKCQEFKNYTTETLGPIAWKFKVGRSENVGNFEGGVRNTSYTTFTPTADGSSNTEVRNETEESTSTKKNFSTQNI